MALALEMIHNDTDELAFSKSRKYDFDRIHERSEIGGVCKTLRVLWASLRRVLGHALLVDVVQIQPVTAEDYEDDYGDVTIHGFQCVLTGAFRSHIRTGALTVAYRVRYDCMGFPTYRNLSVSVDALECHNGQCIRSSPRAAVHEDAMHHELPSVDKLVERCKELLLHATM